MLADPADVTTPQIPSSVSREQLWYGPDVVVLGYSVRGHAVELAQADERYVTTDVAGGFTGRVVGVYARTGHVTLRT